MVQRAGRTRRELHAGGGFGEGSGRPQEPRSSSSGVPLTSEATMQTPRAMASRMVIEDASTLRTRGQIRRADSNQLRNRRRRLRRELSLPNNEGHDIPMTSRSSYFS